MYSQFLVEAAPVSGEGGAMNRLIRCVAMALALSVLLAGLASPVGSAPGSDLQAQGTTVHIVQWGESLTIIAGRYGVTAASIAQANGLYNPNFIYAGQRLVIPTGAAPAPPSGATTTYVVQPGDTLNVIAARFGTAAAQLHASNGLWNPNFI